MKKTVSVFLVLALALACLGASAAVAYRTLFYREGFYRFAMDGNDVWIADEDGLWLSKGGTDAKLLLERAKISAVDARGGLGYIAYEDGGDWFVAEADREGRITREWLVPAEYISEIVALESGIALLNGELMEGELLLLDKATGVMKNAEGPSDLGVICAGADGTSVLVGSLINGRFWRADIQSALAEEIGSPDEYANSILETEDGKLRMLLIQPEYVKIFEYTPGGECTEYGEIPLEGMTVYSVRQTQEHIFMQTDKAMRRYNVTDFKQEEPKRELVIALDIAASGDMRFAQAIRVFQTKYPDVRVRQDRVQEEELVLSLMAGEKTCDIFFMNLQSTDELQRAGLFADMREYPQITQELENWIDMPGILYDTNGRLIRVPVSIPMGHGWAVPFLHHYDLLIESGLEIPMEPMDHEQFRALCAQAREKGIYLYAAETRVQEALALYIALYADPINGVLDFDTPEFRQIMEFWKQLKEDDLVLFYDTPDATPDEIMNDDTYLFVCGYGARGLSYHRDPAVRQWLYPPTPEGTPVLPTSMDALYLYEYGAQKELAADFIASYASVEAQAAAYEGKHLYLKDVTQYTGYEQWIVPFMTGYARWPELGMVEEQIFYPEKHEMDKELYTYGVPLLYMTQLRLQYYEQAREYMVGNITLDEMISVLNEKADIWLNE